MNLLDMMTRTTINNLLKQQQLLETIYVQIHIPMFLVLYSAVTHNITCYPAHYSVQYVSVSHFRCLEEHKSCHQKYIN